jgi:hypothetical protein
MRSDYDSLGGRSVVVSVLSILLFPLPRLNKRRDPGQGEFAVICIEY